MSERQDADIEALAGLIAEHGPSGFINSREGWIECLCDARLPLPGGFDSDGYPMDADAEDITRAAHLAHAILASDWLAERERAAAARALRKFVQWVATQRAYNGSDHKHAQSLYNECVNAVLPEWVEDYIRPLLYTPEEQA